MVISGLTDEISIQFLVRVPNECYSRLKLVCKTWNFVLTNLKIFKLRKYMGSTKEWHYILLKDVEEKKCIAYIGSHVRQMVGLASNVRYCA